MDVIIDEIGSASNSGLSVKFATTFGRAQGIWKSPEAPQLRQECRVEFEIPARLFWRKEIDLSEGNRYSISGQDGNIVMIGSVELIGGDGSITVRIGGSLILLEAQGVPMEVSGKFVRIRTPVLYLYDTRF
jgi:hypothetical protein